MTSLRIVLASITSLLAVTGARSVWACGGGTVAHTAAFPGTAADVSPQSSIFVMSGVDELPAGLSLQVSGTAVSLPTVVNLGRGVAADGVATFFRIAGPLQPSADYTLQMTGPGGTPQTLTHFQTAASYDKTPGTPATLHGLRLWRVHYPKSLVNAGGCVGSEYEGYFALDFTPASLPGTPAGEVVSVLSLASQELGTTQQFVFSGGVTALPGGFTTTLSGDGVTLPDGGALSAGAALWRPDIEPGRTYCATIASYGRNDLATGGPLPSASSCALAVGIDYLTGAGGAGNAAGAGGAAGNGGAGGGRAGLGGDVGGVGGGRAGAAGDAPAGTGGMSYPNADNAGAKAGCNYVASPAHDFGAGAVVLIGLVLARLRRRRS